MQDPSSLAALPQPTRSLRVAHEECSSKTPDARGRVMSDLSRSRRDASALSCPRCGTMMDEVMRIEPVAGEPGLIAFECPNCRYVTSVLQQPKKAR
jgi:predicted RNA-binding Zn-ribbon protein involved in translation (DUF1610 family)